MFRNLLDFIKHLRDYLKKHSSKYSVNLPYLIILFIALSIFVGGIKLFIKLTESLQTDLLASYDTSISEAIVAYRSPALTSYFTFVTDLGDTLGYLIMFVICTALFYAIFKNWKYVIQISVVLIMALSSNLLLKQFISRARPTAEHLVTVKTLSYPSGHAMMAMAFYGFLIYLAHHFKISKITAWLVTIILVILILSIGVSRIYLGVHFPSDIAGGFIAGFIWVIFCAILFNLIQVFKSDPAT